MNSFRTVFIALAGACLAVAGTASAQYNTGRAPPMGATGVDTSHIKVKPRSDPTVADQPTSLTGQVQLALDKLEGDLRIGAHQQKAWEAYRSKVVRYAEDLTRGRYSARDMQDGSLTVPQQLNRLSEIANNRMTAVEEIIDASRAVYETLGSEQKQVADKDLVSVPLRLVSGSPGGAGGRPDDIALPGTQKKSN
jgi:LTXXQ motif family protein